MIIFVIGGGFSPEWEVSIKSAQFVHGELKEYHDSHLITINNEEWYAVYNGDKYFIDRNDFSFTVNEKKIIPDIVVNLIHGTPGEDGLLQGYFDTLGIKHTSCSTLSSVITFDKVLCKRLLLPYNIPMAQDIIIEHGSAVMVEEVINKLALPLFVKPSNSGSSFGVSKVKSAAELLPAVEAAYTKGGVVVVEEAIEGREVACGVYITGKGATFLPVTEIISKKEFFDYEAKYQGASDEITPADISEEVREMLEKHTLTAYKALRCSGFVRVDYIIRDEIPYLIEVNSIPGMSGESIIPQQLKVAGIAVVDMFNEIFNSL